MAEKYYQTINGERVEITGDELTAKQAEWKAVADGIPAVELEQLRAERNAKLADCDWVVVKAQEDDTAVPAAWVTYRQKLRDITKTYKSTEEVDEDGNPTGFAWPEKPSG